MANEITSRPSRNRTSEFLTVPRQQIPAILTSVFAFDCNITLIRIVNDGTAMANVRVQDGNGNPYVRVTLPPGGSVADEAEAVHMPGGVQWISDAAGVYGTINLVQV